MAELLCLNTGTIELRFLSDYEAPNTISFTKNESLRVKINNKLKLA